MDSNHRQIELLIKRLNSLVVKQDAFSEEIRNLKSEIDELKVSSNDEPLEVVPVIEPTKAKQDTPQTFTQESNKELFEPLNTPKFQKSGSQIGKKRFAIKTDLEKFIGENLISKIGIAVTIIGVSIGVKYSIDNDLITPLMRVISGYTAGVVMLIIGIKLKKNYEQYSAVLVSGAMAIMYFITYVAYGFYGLMPLSLAFSVMVLFTIFVVLASISYDQQIISLIGLVGAYAVPFLLSDESGDIRILFSYVCIINVGILVVSFWKYWKLLYHYSFILSWAIFSLWYFEDYNINKDFYLALTFAFLFFIIFYATFLAYKLIKKEVFNKPDILFLIMNSFIFYGIGYMTLEQHETGENYLGLFTIANGMIHLIISGIVFRQDKSDKNLFYLIFGLVLVFITISIPVQLNGKWVTLLWIGEATILFWIGRTKSASVYESISYPLIFLAFLSLLHDWNTVYEQLLAHELNTMITPVFNAQFLSSFIFIACLGFINFFYYNPTYKKPATSMMLSDIAYMSIPGLFLLTIYLSIYIEISIYFDQLITIPSSGNSGDATTLRHLKAIWLINYSMIYLTVLSSLNIVKIRSGKLAGFSIMLNSVVICLFLLIGLYEISMLREIYLEQTQASHSEVGLTHIYMRYISLLFAGVLLVVGYKYVKQEFMKQDLKLFYGIFMHLSFLWILSSELIHWLEIAGLSETYKLGLSILWGSYSLLMVILGIWKKKKYMRLMGITIFAITLVKLFLYDVSELETIPKTILFLSLGILLLIISFLYNKYKHLISE